MFSEIRLKEIRIEKKYSQSKLANLLEINRASYNKWESGKSTSNQNLVALAAVLEVPVTYFESEYNIVNNFLQLNDFNKVLAEEYMEDLLRTKHEEERKVVQLFPVEVLDDISLSAGPDKVLRTNTRLVLSTLKRNNMVTTLPLGSKELQCLLNT